MRKVDCERVEMSWRTKDNHTDCGIFMMRHMETYVGCAKNWKCGFKNEGTEQQSQIEDLRKKYLAKILKAEINTQRSSVMKELAFFRRLGTKDKFVENKLSMVQERVQKLS